MRVIPGIPPLPEYPGQEQEQTPAQSLVGNETRLRSSAIVSAQTGSCRLAVGRFQEERRLKRDTKDYLEAEMLGSAVDSVGEVGLLLGAFKLRIADPLGGNHSRLGRQAQVIARGEGTSHYFFVLQYYADL
jgi:hypothetical protein